ncbi:tetratricopeptide repeat protein [Pseudochryseolinea flava]|uniref:Cytochrome C biosynthesis protein n=1 Tax=Pseudochryseolinea flava TaxID=2059302 RepID=A0A364XYH5_9BACT|nr:tetratricopeptide repeat protein [Pseudochryseolinea flava]RAV99371.1 cytochrome C biosynthesis protein [Pseudochryseolinea flava]
MAKKEEHKHELLENPEALKNTLVDAENWLERNPKISLGIAAVVVLAVAGFFGFKYYTKNQNLEAQKLMFQAVYYFEQDSLTYALEGDGNNLGFKAIIDRYSMTDAANLASYYAGACLLKQGDFKSARTYLEKYSSNDVLVQARAYALIGDTYMEEGAFEDAAKFYSKAANHEPNKFFSPAYLMKEALAYEKLSQNDKAKEAYDKIITQFVGSPEYQNARKYKARLETNS